MLGLTRDKGTAVLKTSLDRKAKPPEPILDHGLNPDGIYADSRFLSALRKSLGRKTGAVVVMGSNNYSAVQQSKEARETWMKWIRKEKVVVVFNASTPAGTAGVELKEKGVQKSTAISETMASAAGPEIGNKTRELVKQEKGGIFLETFFVPVDSLVKRSREMAAGDVPEQLKTIGMFGQQDVMRFVAEHDGNAKILVALDKANYNMIKQNPEARLFWEDAVAKGAVTLYSGTNYNGIVTDGKNGFADNGTEYWKSDWGMAKLYHSDILRSVSAGEAKEIKDFSVPVSSL